MKMLFFLAAFLVAIGILVAVHEFGHYWVAKKLGFKVLRFSIGFGKPLVMRVGKDADRTEYCLAAIPLGGYVKLLDEREGEVSPAELHRSFTRRPVMHRIAVLLAGPAMNLLFASILYAILAMVGTEIVKPVVGQVRLDSPAAAAGLQRGDQIVRVGNRNVGDTEELQIALIRQFTDDGVIPLRVRQQIGGGIGRCQVPGIVEQRRIVDPTIRPAVERWLVISEQVIAPVRDFACRLHQTARHPNPALETFVQEERCGRGHIEDTILVGIVRARRIRNALSLRRFGGVEQRR